MPRRVQHLGAKGGPSFDYRPMQFCRFFLQAQHRRGIGAEHPGQMARHRFCDA